MRILLTGGAGYVGSACFRAFRRKGVEAFVLDDLSEGHAAAVEPDRLDRRRPARHRGGRRASSATATSPMSSTSRRRPRSPNRFGTRAATGRPTSTARAACSRRCAPPASGASSSPARRQSTPTASTDRSARPTRSCRRRPTARPSSPSSTCSKATPTPTASAPPRLRYFNASGADPDGAHGEAHRSETHVIPLLIQAALGQRPGFKVFGDRLAHAGRQLRPRLRRDRGPRRGAPARALPSRAGEDGALQPRIGREHQRAGAARRRRARGGHVRSRTRSRRPARATRRSWWPTTPRPGAGWAGRRAIPASRRSSPRPSGGIPGAVSSSTSKPAASIRGRSHSRSLERRSRPDGHARWPSEPSPSGRPMQKASAKSSLS